MQQEQSLSDACLYFGCRNYNDSLYQEQLQAWQERGVLSNQEVAFSRLGDEKVYVQNLMQQKPQDVWKLLSHPKCHYYVYGDAKMADNVFDVLLAIAKTEGGLSHPEAINFFDQIRANALNKGIMKYFEVVWAKNYGNSRPEYWLRLNRETINLRFSSISSFSRGLDMENPRLSSMQTLMQR